MREQVPGDLLLLAHLLAHYFGSCDQTVFYRTYGKLQTRITYLRP